MQKQHAEGRRGGNILMSAIFVEGATFSPIFCCLT